MRKLISVLLVSIMLLGLCSPVFAASNVTATAEFDSVKNGIVVSGTVNSPRANVALTVTFTDPNGKVVYVDHTVVPYQDTLPQLSYEFEPVTLHLKNITGTYTIEVTGDNLGTAQDTCEFMGADRQYLALKAAAEATTLTALDNALSTKGVDLGIDYALFSSLGDAGRTVVSDIIIGETYTVPVGYSSDEDIEQIMTSITQLRADYNAAIKIGEFNDLSVNNPSANLKLANWLTAYGAEFDADDITTAAVDERKLYDYVEDVADETNFITRICGKLPLTTMDAIRNMLYEQAVLTVIADRHYAEGKTAIETFSSLFTTLDWSKFNALSITDQGWVYENVKGSYDTYIAAGNAFNALVNQKTPASGTIVESPGNIYNPGNIGNTGGTGGGGGGGFISPSVATNPVTGGTVNAETVFPDMGSAQWAVTAVSALKSAGIVSGDENGNFNPDNNITRAEYVKLVVLAMELPLESAGSEFSDVSSNDWHAAYVNTGVKNGLIMGDAENRFNPDEVISREDMCVILYRAFKTSQTGSLNFSDSDMISDYAKNAVAFFVSKEIINGMGNNLFAPKDNATRAQAAQVIYKVLNNMK